MVPCPGDVLNGDQCDFDLTVHQIQGFGQPKLDGDGNPCDLLEDDKLQKFTLLQTKALIRNDPNFKWCPADCGNGLVMHGNPNHFRCDHCTRARGRPASDPVIFCLLCNQEHDTRQP